jgi:hypothetical protein
MDTVTDIVAQSLNVLALGHKPLQCSVSLSVDRISRPKPGMVCGSDCEGADA